MREPAPAQEEAVEARPVHTGSLRRTIVSLGASASLARVMNLGVIAILDRVAGPSAVGRYGVATVAASIAALGFSLGLPTFATRQLAAGELSLEDAAAIHKVRFLILAIVGVGLSLVGSAAYPGAAVGFGLYSCSVLLDQWNDTAWSTIRGTAIAHREAIVNSATYAALLVAASILWVMDVATFTRLAECTAAAAIARTTLALLTSRIDLRNGSCGYSQVVTRHARAALPYLAGDLLGFAYLRGDTLLLGPFVSSRTLGDYVAAATLTSPVVQIGSAMAFGAVAVLSAGARNDPPRVVSIIRLFGNAGIVLAAVAAAAMTPAVLILFGMADSHVIAACGIVLCLFIPIRFVNFALSSITLANGDVRRRVHIVAVSLVVNVGLNLLLDPWAGAFGAAWASVLTELAIFALFVFASGQAIRWWYCAIPVFAVVAASAPAALAETGHWARPVAGIVSAGLISLAALPLWRLAQRAAARAGRVA